MPIRHLILTFLARCGLILALATTPALAGDSDGPPIAEKLVDGVVGYHRDAASKAAALPSYALVKPLTGTPMQPPAGAVVPTFKSIESDFTDVDSNATRKLTLHVATVKIDPATSLYGTGEVGGPLLRNGKKIVCWNTDAYGYDSTNISLYQSHPWVLAVRPDGSSFGLLADTTYRCTVDTAASRSDEVSFAADGPAFPLLVIEGETPMVVLQRLAQITGTMPLPPQWAIGYHQCRYSYYPESRAREIASEFRKRNIPCDVIWYDIDYMEAFRIFTFDRGFFPDPRKLNADLLKDGFHNVWMIDPGMKSRKDPGPSDRKAAELAKDAAPIQEARKAEIAKYERIIESGTKADVWTKRADGTVYEGEVWPSWCFFPDYTAPRVREWWAPLYKDFMAEGITGVWNDMNEPAVFNVKSKTMPLDNLHEGDPSMLDWSGKPQGDRAKGPHARYHNVYGMMMVKGTREGIAAVNPDKRPFVLSRASYIGGHRYAATWTGDNTAAWPHLEESVPMVLNIGLSGQPFIGPDVGGFAADGDGKLFARWMGFGAMLPFSRGHTGKGNIDKEPWAFGPEVENTSRIALQRRYRYLPFYYTLFREASVNGLPVARPTFFADLSDPALRSEDDSFLLGQDMVVVSQMIPDATRSPVMPRGDWREIEKSDNPDLPRLFIRPGAIIPSGPDIEFVNEKPLDPLTLVVSLDAKSAAAGSLYEDAGDGYGYQNGDFLLTRYEASRSGDSVVVKVVSTEGKRARPARTLVVKVVTDRGEFTGEGKDGQPVTVNLTPR